MSLIILKTPTILLLVVVILLLSLQRPSMSSTKQSGLEAHQWQWSCAQTAVSPHSAHRVINIVNTPLVSDWVALCQTLIDVEAIWNLGNGDHLAIVVILARTLEANDPIVQSHLLALRIAGLLPIGPARPLLPSVR